MKRGHSQAFPNKAGQQNVYTGRKVAYKRQKRSPVVPGVTRQVGAYVRSMPGKPQIKYLDTATNGTAISTTGTIVNSLIQIPIGTTDVTRIGNKVDIVSWGVHFTFSCDNQVAATPGPIINNNVRLILYVDHQANGAAATPTDILTTASLSSYRNMDQVERFKVLFDRYYCFVPQCAYWDGTNGQINTGSSKWFKALFKMNLPVHFSGSTGAMTEIKSNNLGMLLISDVSSMNYSMQHRVKYRDA